MNFTYFEGLSGYRNIVEYMYVSKGLVTTTFGSSGPFNRVWHVGAIPTNVHIESTNSAQQNIYVQRMMACKNKMHKSFSMGLQTLS